MVGGQSSLINRQNIHFMPFKFEKLEIWNLAIYFANDVHLLTRKFPKDEMFSLSSQFKRAADSIALNISEGAIGQSNAEQVFMLCYSFYI